MTLQIKKAEREKIWVKIALMSPSGGGKTYSSLRLATGMAKALEPILGRPAKIAMMNSEQKRGYYYANEFDYDIVDILSPHNPEKYVDTINEIVDAGYDILIIDSSSHEWEGKGGCLELHQQAGGTYQAWGKVTPRHNKFIETIADSPIHIIATMRGKDAYEMDKDEKGKTSVKKLGIGAKQRDGFEYEFTATFLIDQQTNMAETQKDNTHIFEDEGAVILSEKHGEQLIKWANSGEGYTIPVRNEKAANEAVADVKKQIVDLCKSLGEDGKKEAMMKIIKEVEPSGNPNKIKDGDVLKQLLVDLTDLKNTELEEEGE